MTGLLSHLPRPVGHILHIGAGYGTDLSDYLSADPQGITLVEPDPEALAHLQAAAAGRERLHVIKAAVSDRPGQAILRRFSFADLNSLRRPKGLRRLFPGLEMLAEEPVQVQDPVSLVGGLELPDDRANVLVLEAPGEAMAILASLAAADSLRRFDAIRIQEGRVPLYDGASGIDEIEEFLGARGFETVPVEDVADPERPHLEMTFDRAAARRKAEVERLAACTAELEAERDALRDELASARTSLETERGGRESVEAENRSLRERLDTQQTERRALEEALTSERKARSAAEAALQSLRKELEVSKGERDALAAERETAEARARSLEERIGSAEEEARTALEARDRVVEELDALSRAHDAAGASGEEEEETRRELDIVNETRDRRLALSREEMLKAEGQIDLIKELLLGGPGL